MLTRILASLDPQALLHLAARQLEVPPQLVTAFMSVLESGAEKAGVSMDSTGLIKSLLTRDKQALKKYSSTMRDALADEKQWPMLASVINSYVLSHPKGQSVLEVTSRFSKLPIQGFAEQHTDLQDFLVRALFPRMRQWLATDATCVHCGAHHDQLEIFDDVVICRVCDAIQ